MNLDELAETRRSVRKYKAADLSADEAKAKLTEMVDFARKNAPSWKNSQTHRYRVALSAQKIAAVRDSLVERNRAKCDNAVALIVSSFVSGVAGFSAGVPDNELADGWGAYDLGLSDSLLILKARELGLDTLIMGLRNEKSIRAALEIPETEKIVSVISVGVRADEVVSPPRKNIEEIAQFF